jgi:hypothetical protein
MCHVYVFSQNDYTLCETLTPSKTILLNCQNLSLFHTNVGTLGYECDWRKITTKESLFSQAILGKAIEDRKRTIKVF